MNHQFRLKSLLAVPALLFMTLQVFAQEISFEEYDYCDSVHHAVYRDARARLERLTVDFWEPRLNSYRLRIDRTLSARDLSDLNELRVRFTVGLERLLARYQELTASSDELIKRFAQLMASDSVKQLVQELSDASGLPVDDTVSSPSVGGDGLSAAPVENDVRFIIHHGKSDDTAELAARFRAAARIAAGYPVEGPDHEVPVMEDTEGTMSAQWSGGFDQRGVTVEIPAIASWVTRNYRSTFDTLKDDMCKDLGSFVDSAEHLRRSLEEIHRDAFLSCPDLGEYLGELIDVSDLRPVSQQSCAFRSVYRKKIESLVPLYTGQTLASLVDMALNGIVEPASDELPHEPMLRQISANPVSTSVTIAYTLPESSSGGEIRIVDGQGVVVMSIDQGRRDAGTHHAAVDVSGLPAGFYVYQLTTNLASGQRIWSRVMQVVR